MVRIERLGADEASTLQMIAAHLGVGVSALTHALPPLIRDGLVALSPDRRDKRSKRAVLTSEGHRRVREGGRLWAMAHQRPETLLGAEDASRLRTLAERISSDDFSTAFKSELCSG